jgi:transposase
LEDLIMSETTRVGRRAKRFLTPSKKYEIWLQLVRQEVTIAEAAADHGVDRSTIMRTVAKEGALAALAASKPGAAARQTLSGGATIRLVPQTH